MSPIETGGAKREYTVDEKQALQDALKDQTAQTSQELFQEHKEITKQLQSTNVLYMQQNGNKYLSDIQGLSGYDATKTQAFKEKIEQKYAGKQNETAIVAGRCAIRDIQLLAVKACEHKDCTGTNVQELLDKGIISYGWDSANEAYFDGMAGPNFARTLFELTDLHDGETITYKGREFIVPLFNGELTDDVVEYLLWMATDTESESEPETAPVVEEDENPDESEPENTPVVEEDEVVDDSTIVVPPVVPTDSTTTDTTVVEEDENCDDATEECIDEVVSDASDILNTEAHEANIYISKNIDQRNKDAEKQFVSRIGNNIKRKPYDFQKYFGEQLLNIPLYKKFVEDSTKKGNYVSINDFFYIYKLPYVLATNMMYDTPLMNIETNNVKNHTQYNSLKQSIENIYGACDITDVTIASFNPGEGSKNANKQTMGFFSSAFPNYIFINKNLDGDRQLQTITNELSHYIFKEKYTTLLEKKPEFSLNGLQGNIWQWNELLSDLVSYTTGSEGDVLFKNRLISIHGISKEDLKAGKAIEECCPELAKEINEIAEQAKDTGITHTYKKIIDSEGYINLDLDPDTAKEFKTKDNIGYILIYNYVIYCSKQQAAGIQIDQSFHKKFAKGIIQKLDTLSANTA